MDFDQQPNAAPQIKRIPLGTSRRRLGFERRLRLWLYLLAVPTLLLCWALLWQHSIDIGMQFIILFVLFAGWAFAVSLLTEQIVRPLQTLANVVASLREDDYSFRARGGRRNDALGDLALEINALAGMLQGQRAGALEAMALLQRVMASMESPVLAFDPDGRLLMLNAAGERAFGRSSAKSLGKSATELQLAHLLTIEDGELVLLRSGPRQP